jgi:hypothetical protein
MVLAAGRYQVVWTGGLGLWYWQPVDTHHRLQQATDSRLSAGSRHSRYKKTTNA